MRRTASPQTPDLLAWPEVAEARTRALAAEAARQAAARRWRLAPHGEVQKRLKALQEASQEALRAQLALEKLTTPPST